MEAQKNNVPASSSEKEETKLLGAHVDVQLYWQFKKAAAARNEQLKEAIEHAAHMYIDSVPKQRGDT